MTAGCATRRKRPPRSLTMDGLRASARVPLCLYERTPRRLHVHARRRRGRHAHRERAGAGWPLDRDPLPAHTVRNATVGGIRDARTAGIRPANAPMRMAEAMPPVHASTGITMSQFFELA